MVYQPQVATIGHACQTNSGARSANQIVARPFTYHDSGRVGDAGDAGGARGEASTRFLPAVDECLNAARWLDILILGCALLPIG